MTVIPKPCDSNPCLNQGSCTDDIEEDEFLCTCQRPWRGKRCETGKILEGKGVVCDGEWCINQ